jgi:antirestriction protein
VKKYTDPDTEKAAAKAAFRSHYRTTARWQEAYEGHHEDAEAFARHLVVGRDGVFAKAPELAKYFDFAEYARVLFLQDFTVVAAPEAVGGVFVFRVL